MSPSAKGATTRRECEFLSISSLLFFFEPTPSHVYGFTPAFVAGFLAASRFNSRHADDELSVPAEVKGGGGDGILAGSLRFAGINNHHTSA